jgi:flagellar basal body-associated protein FliL
MNPLRGCIGVKRKIPIAVAVIVIIIAIVIVGFLFYKGTQTPPPQEVNPLTGEPIKQGAPSPLKATPEHGR